MKCALPDASKIGDQHYSKYYPVYHGLLLDLDPTMQTIASQKQRNLNDKLPLCYWKASNLIAGKTR